MLPAPDCVVGIRLGYLSARSYIICIVCVRYSFCGISSISCLIIFFNYNYHLFLALLFSFIIPFDVLSSSSGQIINRYGTNVTPGRTQVTLPKKSVSPSGDFLVSIYHHYGCNSFFRKTNGS